MNKLILVLFISLSAIRVYGTTNCTYSAMDDYKNGNEATVGTVETDWDMLSYTVSLIPYPSVSDVKNCLVTYSVNAAPAYCSDVFDAASSMAGVVIDPTWDGTVFNQWKQVVVVSDSDVAFFREYTNPIGGGYFDSLSGKGYNDFFTNLVEIAEKCSEERGVPFHKSEDLDPTSVEGVSYIDVFKDSVLLCSFMAPIKDDQVKILVPKQFHSCVKTKDVTFVTRLDIRDATTGLLTTKTAVGSQEEFLTNNPNSTYKVAASESNNSSVQTLMDVLDLGVSGINLSESAIRTDDISFDIVASLDPYIFKIVALCEAGVDPANYQMELESWYLADWLNMEGQNNEGDVVSAEDGYIGGYYRAMYYHQLLNSKLFPGLKQLHLDYKNGLITDSDLSNWQDGDAYNICYMNYPLSWIPSQVLDAVK